MSISKILDTKFLDNLKLRYENGLFADKYNSISLDNLKINITQQDLEGRDVILLAAAYRDFNFLNFLLDNEMIDEGYDDNERNILHYLARKKYNILNGQATSNENYDVEICKFWEKLYNIKELDINAKDLDENTPLMSFLKATPQSSEFLITTILNTPNLNLNIEDRDGNTALHIAILQSNAQAALALINAGANLKTLNKNNKTALDLAKDLKQVDIEHAIKKKSSYLDKMLNIVIASLFVYSAYILITTIKKQSTSNKTSNNSNQQSDNEKVKSEPFNYPKLLLKDQFNGLPNKAKIFSLITPDPDFNNSSAANKLQTLANDDKDTEGILEPKQLIKDYDLKNDTRVQNEETKSDPLKSYFNGLPKIIKPSDKQSKNSSNQKRFYSTNIKVDNSTAKLPTFIEDDKDTEVIVKPKILIRDYSPKLCPKKDKFNPRTFCPGKSSRIFYDMQNCDEISKFAPKSSWQAKIAKTLIKVVKAI